ncbi:tail assembly chaperone [Microbacterium phage PhunaPhoke]|nr:tail assembly chaperone [Microbacterium phage PhunaPhoke]
MPSTPQGKKPKKQPTDRKAPQANFGSSWKKPLTDLDLPSGERCQVKRPGVQGLIKAGVLHSLDSLTAIVQSETIPKAEGKPVTDVEAIAADPDKFNKMMETVDKIVCHVVTQPKVLPALQPVWEEAPVYSEDGQRLLQAGVQKKDANGDLEWELIPDEDRDPESVYVDYIDAVDKMFIMNFAVGGSADLAEFRAQTEALVGGVPAGKQLRTRPSELYGVDDELTAWSFDRAVQTFGTALENRLHEVTRKQKNQAAANRKAHQELDKWLTSADTKAVKGRFRDPMATVKA